MSVSKYLTRINILHELIRLESTGTPQLLAGRLGISERSLYGYLQTMRDLGAPIEYSKIKETYFYSVSCICSFKFITE